MSDREQRCTAIAERLGAEPLEQWGALFVAFHKEGFLANEIAMAIECNFVSALIGFFSNIEPRALRAAGSAEMLKNIGDMLGEHEDIKGGHDA